MKCAVLNWQIHKSAAAAAAAGQKAQCKNSLHFRKVTNTQSEGGIYQCYLNTYNPTDYVHVTCSISDKKGCRLLLNCFLWPSLEELHAFSMNKVDKTKGDREFLQYSNYYEYKSFWFKTLWDCTCAHILIQRHCSKAMLGIWIECDKFSQSKYGLINELAS